MKKNLTVARSLSCNQPQCTNPHPRFDSKNYGDRAKKTEEEARELAESRAHERGPQLVTLHHGIVFPQGVWFIQDDRPYSD